MKFNIKNEVIIASHRGDTVRFKENTMDAFKSAIDLKVDMIETDVHFTKDGIGVLIHDDDTQRTTGQEGLIREMTIDEVEKLNAGTEEMPAKIPTLEEFLKLCAPHSDLFMDLEIKVYKHIEGEEAVRNAVDKTIELCEKYNVGDRIAINSFDAYVLEYTNEKYNGKYLLLGYYPYDIMSNVTKDPGSYLDYACYWATGEEAKENCSFLKSIGIELCTGSDTKEEDFYEQVKYGCSMFTENDPEKTLKWRKNLLK